MMMVEGGQTRASEACGLRLGLLPPPLLLAASDRHPIPRPVLPVPPVPFQ